MDLRAFAGFCKRFADFCRRFAGNFGRSYVHFYMRWCSGYENGLVCLPGTQPGCKPCSVIFKMSIVVIVWLLGRKTRQTSRIRRESENWFILGHTPKLPKIIDRRNVQVEKKTVKFCLADMCFSVWGSLWIGQVVSQRVRNVPIFKPTAAQSCNVWVSVGGFSERGWIMDQWGSMGITYPTIKPRFDQNSSSRPHFERQWNSWANHRAHYVITSPFWTPLASPGGCHRSIEFSKKKQRTGESAAK